MTRPSVSIVTVAYRRATQLERTLASVREQTYTVAQVVVVEDGYDGGDTERVCVTAAASGLPVEYVCRRTRPAVGHSCSSVPFNIGFKRARADVVVIHSGAEVMYTAPTTLETLIRPLATTPSLSTFARVQHTNSAGDVVGWYAGPERAVDWYLNFCQAAWRDRILAIGGFDEEYLYYGFEDDDFSLRMQKSGVDYMWTDALCIHQWHPSFDTDDPGGAKMRVNKARFEARLAELGGYGAGCNALRRVNIGSGRFVANEGREWGVL